MSLDFWKNSNGSSCHIRLLNELFLVPCTPVRTSLRNENNNLRRTQATANEISDPKPGMRSKVEVLWTAQIEEARAQPEHGLEVEITFMNKEVDEVEAEQSCGTVQ